MEYLGFCVTREGVNKNMIPPTSQMEVRQFIGLVNYYRNLCGRLSHMLESLTKLTSSRVKFKWTKIKQE